MALILGSGASAITPIINNCGLETPIKEAKKYRLASMKPVRLTKL
jgi:hypothetical protein